jgi:hypothetical protein
MERWLIYTGIFLVLMGVIIKYIPWLVSWFGKLPGDIFYDKGDVKVFFPITSMLLISVILTILIRIIKKFM